MGAWIEIIEVTTKDTGDGVAPLVGAWIEIVDETEFTLNKPLVAPLVGAWIEIAIIR